MNTAIIVAAGSGLRFSGPQAKQFVSLLGKPLIIHTLQRFESCDAIDEIVLVLSEAGRQQFEISNFGSEITKLKQIVIGGATRAESVRNGLDAVDPATANIVAVHDGARALVTSVEITRTVEKADETGAACLVAEINDTVKKVDGGIVMATIDRSCLRAALTPQAFRFGLLKKAFEAATLDATVTDECYLVEKLGVEIVAVEGSSRNIKVTRADDMRIAEMLLCSE
ncbi:MAG: 2-C-methyl-D-erythritol 4-phosphate cytidylyltransferase [Pyrinomonadaceae bacterium]